MLNSWRKNRLYEEQPLCMAYEKIKITKRRKMKNDLTMRMTQFKKSADIWWKKKSTNKTSQNERNIFDMWHLLH